MKKMKVANKKARDYVEMKMEFIGSNLSGHDFEKLYIVYSYNWYPLFVYDKIAKEWYENSDRYSVSTSKQQTQSHPGVECKELKTEYLQEMIRDNGKQMKYFKVTMISVNRSERVYSAQTEEEARKLAKKNFWSGKYVDFSVICDDDIVKCEELKEIII